jgi:hypothetical protein
MPRRQISRRTVLRGLGVGIALPWLEAMMPAVSLAAPAAAAAPKRMAFFYVPNGINMAGWTPKEEGTNFELPEILKRLEPHRDHLLVLSGLTCDKARPNGDGPGDHARAMSAFLTGAQPRKTDGANIKVGISVDQVAAAKVGKATKFSSLEIGCEGGRQAGGCDSGYSCAYSSNLSWRSESTPMVKETNPRAVFERLFGNGKVPAGSVAAREAYKKSILDFVGEDARELKKQLGGADERKLDEYLTAIREIEQRIERAAQPTPLPEGAPKLALPDATPREYLEHLRLLGDLLVLAFQADVTRISTYVLANEGSNRNYKFIDVPEGHHELSHHGRNAGKMAKIQKINTFHMEQFAYIVEKLKGIREGEGSLLDNCMLLYGSGNGDGNRHNHDDLPIILVGKGGGTIQSGRHVRYAHNTPLNNLYLSMLDRMGAPVDQLGDSTGRLANLD